jgi:trans-aconitate 2-methyltransferase
VDWNAGVYHKVSDPQFEWGRRVLAALDLAGDERVADIGCGTGRLTRELAGRVPRGFVLALDRSASMLEQATRYLRDLRPTVELARADAAALPLRDTVDVVFSTATFHWVLDHDALFESIFVALRRGGRLHAQCGGGPNLKRLRDRSAALCDVQPFAPHFRGWASPWHYATPESTTERLSRIGFDSIVTDLESTPTRFGSPAEYREFVQHVCLRPYLSQLPEPLRASFIDSLVTMAASDSPPFVLDYWRLNVRARRG